MSQNHFLRESPHNEFRSNKNTASAECIFLRIGWFVPFTIAESYFGLCFLDPAIKRGSAESQMKETVTCIEIGTILGFVIGLALDAAESEGSGGELDDI